MCNKRSFVTCRRYFDNSDIGFRFKVLRMSFIHHIRVYFSKLNIKFKSLCLLGRSDLTNVSQHMARDLGVDEGRVKSKHYSEFL